MYKAPALDSIEVIFSEEEIGARIHALAGEIAGGAAEDLVIIAILKGSFIFAADLVRALHRAGLHPEMDFMKLSSYREAMQSSGAIELICDTSLDVSGRDVLIVDDILESGRTLSHAKDLMAARGARRVRTCVLLDKPAEGRAGMTAEFTGFSCPGVFVVGYGMDLANSYRELPFIGRIRA